MSLDKIPGNENLYISGIFALRRHKALQDARITHVLSVLRGDVSEMPKEPFKWLQIAVDDIDDENLIQYFAETNQFIREGLDSGGGVLVHCAMGKSRSAAVILAYLLSSYNSGSRPKSVEEALALLRKSRPLVGPNDGFIAQLRLYYEMGCPTDVTTQPAYQRWLHQQEVQLSNACGKAPDFIYFSDVEPQSGEAVVTSPPTNPTSAPPKGLKLTGPIRCRKCRHTLGTQHFIVDHSPKQQRQNQTTALVENDIQAIQPCAHIFLDPLSWMRPELEQGKLSGRLNCPNSKCTAQVGKYAWQGLQCSCGKWIVPGISLSRAKVDEISIGQGTQERKPINIESSAGKGNL